MLPSDPILLWRALPGKADAIAGAIAGMMDGDGNFAQFIVYCRRSRRRVRDTGNLKLKRN
jgi:hypothetical protein